MPSLQEIRQFNQRLVSMGNEPEVVREWGEELEDVPVPETGLDDDLSSLLSDTGELPEEQAAEPAGAPSGEEAPPDFSELLAEAAGGEEDFFGGVGEEPTGGAPQEASAAPGAEEGEPVVADEGDFSDFEALLGGMDEEPDAEEP
ncbi:MAG: periplasmic-type flagellar collar protein FlcA, partial [Spirochaetota bacterium]